MDIAWLKLVSLILFPFFISFGQVCFKLASRSLADGSSVLSLVSNFWLIGGGLVYALCTVFWVWLIRDIPLSKAYPFVAMSFFIVPFMGYLFLGETISVKMIISSILIVIGIIVSF